MANIHDLVEWVKECVYSFIVGFNILMGNPVPLDVVIDGEYMQNRENSDM